MKDNPFQLIIIALFGFFAIGGVIFLGLQNGGSGKDEVDVVIWGTFDEVAMNNLINTVFSGNTAVHVEYEEYREDEFDRTLTEALAEDRGPDGIILRDDQIITHEEKIYSIPYETFSARDFKDAYVSGAEIFLTETGVLGLPFYIDPLVMYWNRTNLAQNSIVAPPSYWDEFISVIPRLTTSDFSGSIIKSGVAFGEFNNVDNAKDIIAAMMMQAGTPIVQRRQGGGIENVFQSKFDSNLIPAETTLRFYTEFADPVKPTYSWNRSLPSALRMFTSGDLSLYFGFASEIEGIRRINPNLDFDVAVIPQIRSTNQELTLARIGAFSVLKRSRDINGTFGVFGSLSGALAGAILSDITQFPPVQRNLLVESPGDAYKTIFYDSALISRSWLDPSPHDTDIIFQEMVEDVTSGRLRVSGSVNRASDLIDFLIK